MKTVFMVLLIKICNTGHILFMIQVEGKLCIINEYAFFQIHFTVNDVKVPEVPGMFTTFLVKKRPLFVDPNMFKDLEHYGRLMGYDQPVNFHLGNQEEKND